MTDIDKLIEELEGAEKGSRNLDIDLDKCLFPENYSVPRRNQDDIKVELPEGFGQDAMSLAIHPAPYYTTSVDAALGLVPEKLRTKGEPGRIFIEHKLGQFWSCQIRMHAEDGWCGMSWAPYPSGPALAICIAALKARKEKE